MEGLGVYLALDGNNVDQFNALHAKVQKWSANITKSYVSRFAADLALRTTIMQTVEYPLAATTFTTKQCDFLLRPILKATLPKLGIARTTGRKFLHGPYYLQGNNISQVYTELGVARLNVLLNHGGLDTQLGKCCLECHQLECGFCTRMFKLNYSVYGSLVTDSTMKHLWEFLWIQD